VLDSKLHFLCHVDCVHSQALRILGLIPFITYNFSSLDSLVDLYNTLVESNPEYASVVWNNLIFISDDISILYLLLMSLRAKSIAITSWTLLVSEPLQGK
jgi:hypothetical protein